MQPRLRLRPIGGEQDAIGIADQKLASRVGLASQFADPRRDVQMQVGVRVEPRAKGFQVMFAAGQMGRDELGFRMTGDDTIAGRVQFIERWKIPAMETPARVAAQLFPAFVEAVDGVEECRGIAAVNQHGDAEVPTGRPNRIPPRVIDLDQPAVGIAVAEPQLLKNLQARHAPFDGIGQLPRGPLGETGALAGPGRGLVLRPIPAPIDMGEDHEPVAVLAMQKLEMGVELIAQHSVQRNADPNPIPIHHADEIGQGLIVVPHLDEQVGVDIHHRKLGVANLRTRDDQSATRLKASQREVATIFTIELGRFLFRGG